MPNPSEPHTYARRALLCVSGMTPQIVTETLHALLTQSPPFVPTEIHLITTTDGEAKAREQLLDKGWLARLCAERGVAMPPLEIVLIGAEGEAALTDIRSDADNTVAADAILGAVRTLAQDEHCAIHASLAGGRKTMSHFMGYALSLFGRAQDRLSHVLVAPDWAERAKDFHYPPAQPTELRDKDERVLGNSAEVVVTLADIPLLRLGDNLPRLLRDGRASFSETVRLANLALGPATLRLDVRRRLTECSGIAVELTPANFAFLAWLALRAATEQEGVPIGEWQDADVAQYLDVLAAAVGYHDADSAGIGHDAYEQAERALRCNTATQSPSHHKKTMRQRKDYLTGRRGDLNQALVAQLGEPLAAHFLPPGGQKRGETRYYLGLLPEAIRLYGLEG